MRLEARVAVMGEVVRAALVPPGDLGGVFPFQHMGEKWERPINMGLFS